MIYCEDIYLQFNMKNNIEVHNTPGQDINVITFCPVVTRTFLKVFKTSTV